MNVRTKNPAAGTAMMSVSSSETSSVTYIKAVSATYGSTDVATSSALRRGSGLAYGAKRSRQNAAPDLRSPVLITPSCTGTPLPTLNGGRANRHAVDRVCRPSARAGTACPPGSEAAHVDGTRLGRQSRHALGPAGR